MPENVIRPDLLPAQCEEATQSGINPNTGQMEKIRPFGNWSPRLSVTYDLFGNGKTALKGSVLVLLQDAGDAGRQPQRPVHR